jgi:hypothetical protein
MKRKFIALAIAGCFVSALSHAQIKKGSLLFGGSVGYSSNSQEDVDALDNKTDRKGKVLVLSPSFAMAVADNLFVGADLNWEKGKNTTTYPSKIEREANYKTIGGGVFVRKYWSVVNNLYIFGQGRAGFGSFKNDLTANDATNVIGYTKGHTIEASVYPGLSFALSKKVHLESIFWNLINVEYSKGNDYSKIPNTPETKMRSYNDLDVSSSFSNSSYFTLGIKVLLSK